MLDLKGEKSDTRHESEQIAVAVKTSTASVVAAKTSTVVTAVVMTVLR